MQLFRIERVRVQVDPAELPGYKAIAWSAYAAAKASTLADSRMWRVRPYA